VSFDLSLVFELGIMYFGERRRIGQERNVGSLVRSTV